MNELLVKLRSSIFDRLTPNGWRRSVYERSAMSHNDEVVIHHRGSIHPAQEAFANTNSKQLVFTRPVFEEEKLKMEDNMPKRHHSLCGLTGLLDAAYRLEGLFFADNPTFAIPYYVGVAYYDCMSGYMPQAEIILVRLMIETLKLDLSTWVYPRTEGEDYVLRDFMNDTDHLADLWEIECRKAYGIVLPNLTPDTVRRMVKGENEERRIQT